MDEKKDVHHESPNIDVVKHHQDSLPSWDELKYFIRKYYLFLLIIALIPVALFSLGQQLANFGSAAPRLKLGPGAKVGMQAFGCAGAGDQCYINNECVSKGIGKTSKGVCYNCSDPVKNTYNLNPANCEPSATPVVCVTTGYECGTDNNCYAMGGGKFIGGECQNTIEPTKTKCGPNECKAWSSCVGTGYECISNECYLRNGQDNGRKTDPGGLTLCDDKKVDLSNCPNSCGQGVPATTAAPQGGVKVGCSCLNAVGDPCKNSDGSDASRIGNSECPPDGPNGQACCINY